MKILKILVPFSLICVSCSPKPVASPTSPTQVPMVTCTTSSTTTPLPTATPKAAGPRLCSPLEGITLQELPDILSNPFNKPLPGHDDGHHGVDFSFWRYKQWVGMAGLEIHSVLEGTVAATIFDREPYGNAIIIETKLDNLPLGWEPPYPLLTPQPTVQPHPSMTCPSVPFIPASDKMDRSVYLLYAHMQEPTQLEVGQKVTCGQVIGKVGTTGNSVNDHLHFETRVGSSGIQFGNMLFYETGGTPREYADYCTWRVSGLFQMFDPMLLLSPPEEAARMGG